MKLLSEVWMDFGDWVLPARQRFAGGGSDELSIVPPQNTRDLPFARTLSIINHIPVLSAAFFWRISFF